MVEWISVYNRLPYYDNPVLVASSVGGFVGIAWYHVTGRRWELLFGNRYDRSVITHWMPLPKAPMEEKK